MKKGFSGSQFSFTRKLPKNSKWILEFTQSPHSAHLFGVRRKICHRKTRFQTVDIADLFHYGRSLFLDERLQTTEADEFLYHEPISHPALLTHPEPRRVLIIGGADGGAARQVLKHKSVESLIMVDIDDELIKLCKKFLKKINNGVFRSPKLKIFTADGRKFLKESKEKFDVIINDLTAPLTNPPSYLLFTREFYKIALDKLAREGILSLQADGANHLSNKNFISICKTVEKVFPIVRPFSVFIPSYDDKWGFIVASKKYDPVSLGEKEIRERIKKRGLSNLKFYDERIHRALFVLPKYIQEAIKKQKRIIRDSTPIISSQ